MPGAKKGKGILGMIPKNRIVKDIRVACKDAFRQDWPVGSGRHVLVSYPERPGVLGAPQVAAALSVLIFETFHRQPPDLATIFRQFFN